jgi:mediator of RNA polymerase II transcription subunit 4
MNIDPLKQFEENMNALVQSIQHYTPNTNLASVIIQNSDRIGYEIDILKEKTKSFVNYDTTKQKYHEELSNELKEVLNTLVECKRSLDDLPKPDFTKEFDSQRTDKNPDIEDTKTILSYALKLSKFSKIPKTFDGFLLPNNFIWPGDDNMRRGNLAIASIMPDKIIQTENYGENYVPVIEEDKNSDEMDIDKNEEEQNVIAEDDSEDEFLPERTKSIDKTAQIKPESVMAGLDLLDSDDE